MSDTDTVPGWWQPHAARFPRWHAWRGVNDRYYARLPLSSPAVVVSDKGPAALADRVRQAETGLAPWWQVR